MGHHSLLTNSQDSQVIDIGLPSHVWVEGESRCITSTSHEIPSNAMNSWLGPHSLAWHAMKFYIQTSIYWYLFHDLSIPYAPCMVYLPTKLGDFVRANVGKYSNTMERMGFPIPLPKSRRSADLSCFSRLSCWRFTAWRRFNKPSPRMGEAWENPEKSGCFHGSLLGNMVI